jgi:hypothetical protein
MGSSFQNGFAWGLGFWLSAIPSGLLLVILISGIANIFKAGRTAGGPPGGQGPPGGPL